MNVNKLIVKATLFAAIFVFSSPVFAATFYVDATNGNDLNNGLSTSAPWKNISKVNASTFNPGDQILFKRGETWREQLSVPSAGVYGNPIIFDAYGTGDKPIISGADLIAQGSWGSVSSAVWSTPVNIEPKIVFFDGTLGNRVTSITNMRSTHDWFWTGNILYVYSTANPDIAYTNPGVEAGNRVACIFNPNSYVTIRNLHATESNSFSGIFIWTNAGARDGIAISGCTASNNYGAGIAVANSHATLKTTNVTVIGNTVYNNGSSGIDINTGVNNVTVEHTISYNNTWSSDFNHDAGIHFWGNQVDGNNLTVRYNESYGNKGKNSWGRGNGIHIDEVGSNVIVAYNYVHDNDDLGIFVEHSANVNVQYNIVHNNGEDGILIFRFCSGTKVYNNVAYANKYGISIRGDNSNNEMVNNEVKNNISVGNNIGQLVAVYGGNNDGTRGYGNVYSYNCFASETNGFIEWGAGVIKSTYTSWETAYGQSTNSVKFDPQFVSSSNVHLKSTSPCISAGTDVGILKDYDGNDVPKGSGINVGVFQDVSITRPNPPGMLRILQ